MDSNGVRFLLLHGAEDFRTAVGDDCEWDQRSASFRLAWQQRPRLGGRPLPNALADWLAAPPLVRDAHGQLGRISADGTRFEYSPGWPVRTPRPVLASAESAAGGDLSAAALDPVDAPPGTVFLDLHLGGDGRAALAYSDGAAHHGLLVVHLGRRWQQRCALGGAPGRVWVDTANRIWVGSDQGLALCSGEPLPQAYRPRATRFEPLHPNPHPLAEQWRRPLPPHHGLLALCADDRHLYLLTWQAAEATASGFRQFVLRRPLEAGPQIGFEAHALPDDLPFALDLALVAPGRLVLMLPRDPDDPGFARCDLPAVELAAPGQARLVPRRYPQNSQLVPRFVPSADGKLRYLSEDGPRQLHPLAQARFPAAGAATLRQTLDAGTPDALWHRIYLDACIPSGCRLTVAVRVFEDAAAPGDDWQTQPEPLWLPLASELPFHAGWRTPVPQREGLFEVLLQRSDGAVRELRGRYLQLRLQLHGDGRHSPAIHAMRVYCPRFSWQQAYLPRHFHQQQRPAAGPGPANGADLRERLLASFEGMLTPLEDRIAAAECWVLPQAAPRDHLPRLARLLGASLPAHWPEGRQRAWLACHGELQRRRGTYAGLCLALDIATDGAVGRGQVVPVENYRLRRTLATILGLDLDDRQHPLTLGTGQSGNSIVGQTLILSDEEAREFLALFAPEVAATAAERRSVADFFDRYAYRLSVVLHGAARALRQGVEQVLQDQAPAALQWRIIETDHPFVLGLSPLLGIDTYLEVTPPWRRVVLDDTYLGREGVLRNPVALSPHHAAPEST